MGCIFVLYLFTGCNLFIVVMGCKWVYLSVYGLYLQYLVRFVRYGMHIGAIMVITAVTGVHCTRTPPYIETWKSGLPQNFVYIFFYFFYFFIFPVGVVSSFAGFFL